MTGPRAARAFSPHPTTSSRIVEKGDLGVLELATVMDGYWSDLTRTLVAGAEPSTQQQEMYESILDAHAAVMRGARPGVTGGAVDRMARQVIDQHGYGKLFVHQTGHGLGFRYHEPTPLLHPGDETVIEEGMVSSVEPGLYVDGLGGMRLEENVVYTSKGAELLSTFDQSLSS
jgi:Xaa-Pro aminopeptidase